MNRAAIRASGRTTAEGKGLFTSSVARIIREYLFRLLQFGSFFGFFPPLQSIVPVDPGAFNFPENRVPLMMEVRVV